MAGGYKKIHKHPKVNTNGLDKHPENINRKGRPVSIKNEIKQVLLKDGEIPIPKSVLVKETAEYYIFKVPTQEALAMKLISMAMSKGNNSFNALKLLMETFDGKATQKIDAVIDDSRTNIADVFPKK